MLKEVSQATISAELKPDYRPPAMDAGITLLPLNALGDREFELLSYLLVKAEIEAGAHKGATDIALMQGVSERGRDCVLYKNGVVCGLIQCKKYAGRVTKPAIIKEIIKFALFATLDKTILPNPDEFEYNLYVSNDLTEPAIALIHSYTSEILSEIANGKIKEYARQVIDEYESFASCRRTPPDAEVEDIIKRISVSSSNSTDLSQRIYQQNQVLKSFFNVVKVVSIEDADTLVRKAFDDYGLKFLTDEGLKEIQSRISDANQDHRINFGLADFYGYSVEFFRHLDSAELKEVLRQVASLKAAIDLRLIKFVQSQISERVVSNITVKLLHTCQIRPFSISVAAPYLFKRLAPLMISMSLPDELAKKIFPDSGKTKEEVLGEVKEQVFSTSEKIMQGDYTSLVGDAAMIETKLQLFAHMHRDFPTINDAIARFNQDIVLIQPELDRIEDEIKGMLSTTRTIVIKDGSFFGDKAQLNMILKTIKALECE